MKQKVILRVEKTALRQKGQPIPSAPYTQNCDTVLQSNTSTGISVSSTEQLTDNSKLILLSDASETALTTKFQQNPSNTITRDPSAQQKYQIYNDTVTALGQIFAKITSQTQYSQEEHKQLLQWSESVKSSLDDLVAGYCRNGKVPTQSYEQLHSSSFESLFQKKALIDQSQSVLDRQISNESKLPLDSRIGESISIISVHSDGEAENEEQPLENYMHSQLTLANSEPFRFKLPIIDYQKVQQDPQSTQQCRKSIRVEHEQISFRRANNSVPEQESSLDRLIMSQCLLHRRLSGYQEILGLSYTDSNKGVK